MTFCTVCAAPSTLDAETCAACGSRLTSVQSVIEDHAVAAASSPLLWLRRLLYLAPLLMLLSIGGALIQRETAHQAWLASAYASAQLAADQGDLIAARDAFSVLIGYRDADERAQEIRGRLAPLEADYAEGLRAIENGDYVQAVALLEPVAEQAPGLEDVSVRLDDAKRLLGEQLGRDIDAAESARDWPVAEQLLRQLVAVTPEDTVVRSRLADLQRTHGPLVMGWNRSLWLVSPDGSEKRQLSDTHHVIWPTWSPDRASIAFLAPNPDDPMGNVALYIVKLDGSEPLHLVDGVSAHTAPAWSPDGSRIAYTSFAGYDPIYETGSIGVRFVEVTTGKETDLTGDAFGLAFNPVWSPDGASVAFVVKYQGMQERPQHSSGDVLLAQLGEEEFENLTNGAVRYVWSTAWSPDGTKLLLYSLFGQTWYEPPSTTIRLLDRGTGAISDIARINEDPTLPVWSPDGSRFAFTIDDDRLVIADPDGGREIHETENALSGEMTWSPDGQALLVAAWNASAPSTLVDFSGASPRISSVELEFDSNPPFLSPPQWAPAVAVAPEENPAIILALDEDSAT